MREHRGKRAQERVTMQLSTPQTPVMDEQGQNQEVGTQSSFPMWEREAASLELSL